MGWKSWDWSYLLILGMMDNWCASVAKKLDVRYETMGDRKPNAVPSTLPRFTLLNAVPATVVVL